MICYSQVKSEAEQIAVDARQKARDSIAGLRALLERLPPSSTPKILVFVSEGLVTVNETSQLAWLEAKAAESHVTLYALHLQASEYDAARRRPTETYAADRALLEEGLYLMTGVTRGDVFRVVSNSDFAFQRLSLELSGYYLLSFEPEVGERNGRPHDIQVNVRRKGVTVRSRRQFTIGPTVVKTVASDITASSGAPASLRDSDQSHHLLVSRDPLGPDPPAHRGGNRASTNHSRRSLARLRARRFRPPARRESTG